MYLEVSLDPLTGLVNVLFNDLYNPLLENSRKKISVDRGVLHTISQYSNRIEIDLNEGDWVVGLPHITTPEMYSDIIPVSKINGIATDEFTLDDLQYQIELLKTL